MSDGSPFNAESGSVWWYSNVRGGEEDMVFVVLDSVREIYLRDHLTDDALGYLSIPFRAYVNLTTGKRCEFVCGSTLDLLSRRIA